MNMKSVRCAPVIYILGRSPEYYCALPTLEDCYRSRPRGGPPCELPVRYLVLVMTLTYSSVRQCKHSQQNLQNCTD